jgi:hypothetical protein
MIIVKLMGGMGNQMFQYAFARSLSLKTNTEFKMDLSFLKRRDLGGTFTYRDFDLDIFNISENLIKESPTDNLQTISEKMFSYSQETVDAIKQSIGNGLYLDGYWQSYKYFEEFNARIKKDFLFKNSIKNNEDTNVKNMINDIMTSNSVMLNIRRTDYLNNNYHGVMGTEYINEASKIIESKIDNPKYFVFSDDIGWCKENLKLDNMIIVDHKYKGDKFDLYLQLMNSCKHFIIPNSSFAWWSAWLSDNKNKIVISPKSWFTDSNINTNDLIPSNWVRI